MKVRKENIIKNRMFLFIDNSRLENVDDTHFVDNLLQSEFNRRLHKSILPDLVTKYILDPTHTLLVLSTRNMHSKVNRNAFIKQFCFELLQLK